MPCFPAIGQPIAEILRFNGFHMVAVRHLGFLKFEIITANERHLAKSCADRLKHCGDMSIFDFQDGGSFAILDFFTHVWTTYEKYSVVFVIGQNLVGIGAVFSTIC